MFSNFSMAFWVVLGTFFSTCKISIQRMALRRSVSSHSQDVLSIKISLLHTHLEKQQEGIAISV